MLRELKSQLRAPEGAPLWDGRAEVTVRPASADEVTVWERNLHRNLGGDVFESLEDAIEYNRFAFLVDYLEPDERAATGGTSQDQPRARADALGGSG